MRQAEEFMQPNNEEIIRITAELQEHLRSGSIALIQNGVRLGSLHTIAEASNSLDRLVQDMTEPLPCHQIRSEGAEMSPDGFYYWQARAMKAEAELEQARELARVVVEGAQAIADD